MLGVKLELMYIDRIRGWNDSTVLLIKKKLDHVKTGSRWNCMLEKIQSDSKHLPNLVYLL